LDFLTDTLFREVRARLFAILAKRAQFTKIKLSARLLVRCLDRCHRVKPDPADMF
jgi:hypothetical protein